MGFVGTFEHNLSLWLYEYVWIILLYGHLVYFILKVLIYEKFAIWNEDLPKKVLLKSHRQFMYGSNFYESDVSSSKVCKIGKIKFLLILIVWYLHIYIEPPCTKLMDLVCMYVYVDCCDCSFVKFRSCFCVCHL